MTKEITKAILLQKMEDKLGLREFKAAKFLLDETVVPIYDIQSDLEHWGSYYYNTALITGTGGKQIVTISENVRWHIRAYSLIFISGTVTVAGVYIYRKSRRDLNDFSYLDLTAAQSTSYLRTLPEAVVMEPGDALYVNIDGYTSDAILQLHLDFMEVMLR